MADVQGILDLADINVFMEAVDWSLAGFPVRFEAGEFDLHETADNFEIDLDGDRVVVHIGGEQEGLPLGIDVEGWTEEGLVLWLDRQVRQLDISQGDLIRWLGDVVHDLATTRRIPIAALMRAKYILARKIREKLASFRQSVRDGVYQQFLFDPGAKVQISFEEAFAFEFKSGMYWNQRSYRGRFRFRKHFLGPDQVPAFDGLPGGEEEMCASYIDSLEEVAFWVRNVRQHKNSFRLPTSTGNHYPDFVIRLKDGRTLVVEYKGGEGATSDKTRERRSIGKLWEQASGGHGLYLIVEKIVDGLDPRKQIKRKINAQH
jgi:type III restriction enzyme